MFTLPPFLIAAGVLPLTNAPLPASTTARRTTGRLTIFLGYAPGGGKTSAMLRTAERRRQAGEDVVALALDSRADAELARMAGTFAVIPQRGGAIDLEAALGRHPALALVDDLSQMNPEGSLHPRRYQDVQQLLDAGIDVFATMGIERLESLNDVVSRIADVRFHDTVPDNFVQAADEIELVDVPTEDLLGRWLSRTIYPDEDARLVLGPLFTPANLTALRELALRHMAERVDAQMLRHRQAGAIGGIWPTRDRIIVCIGEAPVVVRLVRLAKRTADRRHVPWIALYVETHRHQSFTEEQRERISSAMRLAEELGAETVTIPGEDAVQEILRYAESRNVTQIIVGKSERPGWVAAFAPSVTDRLLHVRNNIDILVVTPDPEPPATAGASNNADSGKPQAAAKTVGERFPWPWKDYLQAVAALAVATLVNFVFSQVSPFHNYAIVYLTAVMLVAIRQGRGPAIFAALLSAPIYHFMFSEQRYELDKIYRIDVISLLVFLTATIIVSNLAGRVRAQIEATRLSERRSRNLYDFNRKIAVAGGLDDVLWAVVHHVASTVSGKAMVMMPDAKRRGEVLETVAAYPPELGLDDTSEAAADWAWRQGKPAGRGTDTWPGAGWQFLPLLTGGAPLGVLGVQLDEGARLPFSEQTRLLETLAHQAGLAIERTRLASQAEDSRLFIETEKLRSALLSSLSHDLRTPLVSILGSATTLLDLDASLPEPTKRDLVETIREEAERLNRFVQNLLDMTRLGSGALHPRRDWLEIGDLIGASLARSKRQLGSRVVDVEMEPDLPLLSLDYVLIEQVFLNLIENACKYSADGTRITITARRDHAGSGGERMRIVVRDQGPGIAHGERDKVFDMFYRVKSGDSQIAGTGLGLAICRGIVEAHGGTIAIVDNPAPAAEGGAAGTSVEVLLPIGAPPALDEREPAAGDRSGAEGEP